MLYKSLRSTGYLPMGTVSFLIIAIVLVTFERTAVTGSGDQGNVTSVSFHPGNSTNHTVIDMAEEDPPHHMVHYNRLRFVVMAIYMPIFQIIGLFGNALTIVVLARGAMKSSSSVYVAGLAFTDFVFLVLSTPWTLATHPAINTRYSWKTFNTFYLCYFYPIVNICFTTSVWTMVAFTVERFIVVVYPLKKHLVSSRRSKFAVGIVFTFGILINTSRFFERVPLEIIDPMSNTTYYVASVTELRLSQIYISAMFWLTFFVSLLLPFAALGVFNLIILFHIRAASKKAGQLTSKTDDQSRALRESRDSHITRLLLGIVLAFFLCNGTGAVLNALIGITGNRFWSEMWFNFTLLISNALLLINPTVNFVVYTTCSAGMRKEMNELLACGCRLKDKSF